MELDVFLRQSRDYVQGTQMIARSADLLDGADWFFEQALFSAITANRISIALADTEDAGEAIGRVAFSCASSEKIFYLRKASGEVPRRDVPMPVKVVFVAEEPDAVQYRFEGAADFEGLLNVIVQSVKSEHERIFPAATDIWLTGFRGFHVALDIAPSLAGGWVKLRRGRLMGTKGTFQTIWGVSVFDAEGEIAAGTTTFAFKMTEGSIVN